MRMRRVARFLLCALALALVGLPRAARAESVLYRHAVVFSARSERPDATWFVVDDGRFADLGAGVVPSRWDRARVVDLGGRFVAPGFIDAHVHLVDGGLGLAQVDASDAASPADLAKAVQRAALAPIGEWVVVRNVGLAGLGGALPTHARMAAIGAAAGERPLLILLEGGHHAYANRPALARLGFDATGAESKRRKVARDPDGAPTGLLVDEAVWAAMRAVGDALAPEQLALAIVLAERLALRYGITSIGDNTFDPRRMAQYLRMSEAGRFHLRVSARSFGPKPITRFAMKSQGIGLSGKPNPKIRFFGDKYFLDGALTDVGASGDAGQNADGPRYSVTELRDILLFARPFGTAFH